MPGNGKVFVSHTPEDAALCMPLFAALDAWEVDYHAAPAALDSTQQIPPAIQRDIAERDVFIRVCSPAAQRSIAMNLQVSVYRGMQASDRRGSRGNRRSLINLILAPGYVREPFDNATLFIDATGRSRPEWLGELGRALGVRTLRGQLSRRAVLGLGAAAVTTAAALTATGTFLLDYQARTQRPKLAVGQIAWKVDAGNKAPPVPTITDDAVYTFSDTGLKVFRIGDGHPLRHADLIPTRTYGAPQIVGSVLYVGFDDGIYALNTADLSKRWSAKLDVSADIAGGPTHYNGELYVISRFGDVLALGASDGKKRWTAQTTAGPDLDGNISTPVADGSGVYFGSRDHYFYALDRASGSVKWKYLTRGPVYTTPAVANGVVYFGGNDTYVYALKTSDGSLVWRFKMEGAITSSPAVAGGALYIGSSDRHLYALSAGDGSLFWRAPAGDVDNFGFLDGSRVDGSPVVDGEIVAVKASDTIYSFNVRDGSRRWRFKPGASGYRALTDVAVNNGVACFGFRADHTLYTLGA